MNPTPFSGPPGPARKKIAFPVTASDRRTVPSSLPDSEKFLGMGLVEAKIFPSGEWRSMANDNSLPFGSSSWAPLGRGAEDITSSFPDQSSDSDHLSSRAGERTSFPVVGSQKRMFLLSSPVARSLPSGDHRMDTSDF